MNEDPKTDIPPVLIISSDKYSFFWPYFFEIFFRFFPDVNKVYLCAESKKFKHPKVTTLNSFLIEKGTSSWSKNLKIALETIEEENLLILLDDFILKRSVDKKLLMKLYQDFLLEKDCYCLRLVPIPGPDVINYDKSLLGEHIKSKPYRICTQAAFWHKETLNQIIKEGESPWEFEENGTKRAESMKGKVLVLKKNLSVYPINYYNALIRGKMTLQCYKFCSSLGIKVDKTLVKINSSWEDYYWLHASLLERHIMDFITYRLSLMKIFFKIN